MRRFWIVLPLLAPLAVGCVGGGSVEPSVVTVPKQGNASVSSVVPRLDAAGLRVTIPAAWGTNSFSAPGARIGMPAPGTRVPRGTVVTLEMFALVGMPTQGPGRYVVPGVMGDSLTEAMASIEAAGLPWSFRAAALPATATSNLYDAYCVSGQSPEPGTSATVPPATSHLSIVRLQAEPC
jgi:beta-lactam-binding protein with PASTA domain